MPSSRVREWNDASGAHTELLRPDGSWRRWTNGVLIAQSGPDPDRAEAFRAGNFDAVAEAIRYGNELEASPYGQRILEQERRAGQRAREISDREYGLREDDRDLRRDQFGLSEREYDRRFGLDERELDRRFGLDERKFGLDERETTHRMAELDRRFGLDSARFGVEYFQTAAEYGKTPRSWLESLQFENPMFMRQNTFGLTNPAFGARGAVNPGMNTMTDSLAAAGGGGTTAGPGGTTLVDPAKNIQQILKGAPPSESSGFSPKDIAAVQLIARMYEEGAQKLGEGTVESWDPDELAFTQGVMDHISPGGGDRFLRQYGRSRIPGRGAMNPYAAV